MSHFFKPHLNSLLKKEELCEVTLVGMGNKRNMAHKLVLAEFSHI